MSKYITEVFVGLSLTKTRMERVKIWWIFHLRARSILLSLLLYKLTSETLPVFVFVLNVFSVFTSMMFISLYCLVYSLLDDDQIIFMDAGNDIYNFEVTHNKDRSKALRACPSNTHHGPALLKENLVLRKILNMR